MQVENDEIIGSSPISSVNSEITNNRQAMLWITQKLKTHEVLQCIENIAQQDFV